MAFIRTKNPVLIALYSEVRKFNLGPVNRMKFQFDPFHPEVRSIRDFLYHISSRRIRKTSEKCILKTDIVNDRSEPTLNITFDNGYEVIFKTSNLTAIELAEEFNKLVKRFDKPKESLPVVLKGAIQRSRFKKS